MKIALPSVPRFWLYCTRSFGGVWRGLDAVGHGPRAGRLNVGWVAEVVAIILPRMSRFISKIRGFFVGKEPLVFVVALLIVLGVWLFAFVLGEVREGETKNFDVRILRALRRADDPSKLIGPHWMETVVRDTTALGGVVVLFLVVSVVAIYLVLIKRYHMMWLLLASTVGATAINSTIKEIVGRQRPTEVPHITDVSSESFPSGHSAMSAAVYLTLGGLLAQTVSRRRIKLYFIFVAMGLTFIVGLSRVCLGVHYPTDVLAGWTTGLVWALLCWLVARYLQRRGAIEKESSTVGEDEGSHIARMEDGR